MIDEKNTEELLKKISMLKNLAKLQYMGIKLSRNYCMEDDYNEMKFEYELQTEISEKNKKDDNKENKEISDDVVNYFKAIGMLHNSQSQKTQHNSKYDSDTIKSGIGLIGFLGMIAALTPKHNNSSNKLIDNKYFSSSFSDSSEILNDDNNSSHGKTLSTVSTNDANDIQNESIFVIPDKLTI